MFEKCVAFRDVCYHHHHKIFIHETISFHTSRRREYPSAGP
jgi:hypothetical protein